MGRPQVSAVKRQREQIKRERQQVKAAKRAQRKTDKENGIEVDEFASNEDALPDNLLATQ